MFYAIEYANGTRADKVYEFTARRLRDAWVSAGNPDMSASGCRGNAGARHPLVRKADYRIGGDNEGWRVIAEQRVGASPTLSRFSEIIWGDWSEADHARWVATASEYEIVGWARAIAQA